MNTTKIRSSRRSSAPETFAARRRTIYVFFDKCAAAGTAPSASCVERIALGGTSQGGVFEARRSMRAAASNVGRGQQAELWGDEQWSRAQRRHRRAESEGDRHQPVHRVRVLRRVVERRTAGHVHGARREMDRSLQGRRRSAAGARRRPPPGGRSVLPPHAGARLVADADDVLVGGGHAGQNENQRSRLVVAAARQRSRARHVVPAERRRPAQRRNRRADRRRPRHSARRRAALRRRHHRRAAEHGYAAPGVRAQAGRSRRARRFAPRPRQRQRAAGHRHGRTASRPDRGTKFSARRSAG